MKTLLLAMQSSGASFVAFCLAQRPVIAIVDLFCTEPAPPLDDEAASHDVLMKCTIGTAIPWELQVARFRPDRLILVTRNVDAIRASLARKPWRDYAGPMEAKLAVYNDILLRRLERFDEVISYERLARSPPAIVRRPQAIIGFNAAHSDWARANYRHRWGFGALRWKGHS